MGYLLLGAACLGASLTMAATWVGFHDLGFAFLLAPGGASIATAVVVLAASMARP